MYPWLRSTDCSVCRSVHCRDRRLTGAGILLIYWAVVQWIILGPLIVSYQRRGRRDFMKGLIIAGFLGILLNSGCALMLRNGISG
jgi:hypothetical protein